MTDDPETPDAPNRPPPLPPVALEYRPAEPLRNPRQGMGKRVGIGCAVYIVLLILFCFSLGFGVISPEIGFPAFGMFTLALLGAALYVRLKYRIGGYGYGVIAALLLIFLGIPLLIFGICYFNNVKF